MQMTTEKTKRKEKVILVRRGIVKIAKCIMIGHFGRPLI